MNLFYSTKVENHWLYLDAEEARHCAQVLRKQVGDRIHVVDGEGGFYESELIEVHKKSCKASILNTQKPYNPRSFQLHIAIAPTKNISRFEWFLEKATEIGIDEITPLLCFHSERKNIRNDRLEKVLLAAMKQSVKAYLPKLHPMVRYKDFLKSFEEPARMPRANGSQKAYIAHCHEKNIKHLNKKYQPNTNVTILIGPEGDFSKEEIDLAFAKGFDEIGLGVSRLRTETAGVVACHTVNLANE